MSNKKVVIDSNKCLNCGICMHDCIMGCLEFDADKHPTFAPGGAERCIKCQHCFSVCPSGAFSIYGKNPEKSALVPELWNSDEMLTLIKSRRSCRYYKNENLDPERMQKLKDMLAWVPTGVNNHRLHFSFIDDINVMEDFRGEVNVKLVNFIKNTPIKAIKKRFGRYTKAILDGKDVIFRNAPHMVVVSSPIDAPCKNIDPIIALSYFELYANSLGVGTLWCGLAHACLLLFPEFCEQLEIPENYKMSYVMLFGKPTVNYTRTTQPEPYEIVSVKKTHRLKVSLFQKLKRFYWNFIK